MFKASRNKTGRYFKIMIRTIFYVIAVAVATAIMLFRRSEQRYILYKMKKKTGFLFSTAHQKSTKTCY